jgi:hypothetical protein
MGRPGLALGTAGRIRVHATPSGHRAVAWYRDYDGRCRQVERHARTKAAAEAALRLALRDRARFDVAADISPNTHVNVLAEAWFTGLENLSPTTMQAYRNRLDQQVLPGLGNLRVRELSVGTIDRHLRRIAEKHGPAMAKMTKSVLSGVCGLAARHDALERNPVRDTGSIETPTKKAPKASPQMKLGGSWPSSTPARRPGSTTSPTSWRSCSALAAASGKPQPSRGMVSTLTPAPWRSGRRSSG